MGDNKNVHILSIAHSLHIQAVPGASGVDEGIHVLIFIWNANPQERWRERFGEYR